MKQFDFQYQQFTTEEALQNAAQSYGGLTRDVTP